MLKSGESKGPRAPIARPFLFPWKCPRDGGEVDRAWQCSAPHICHLVPSCLLPMAFKLFTGIQLPFQKSTWACQQDLSWKHFIRHAGVRGVGVGRLAGDESALSSPAWVRSRAGQVLADPDRREGKKSGETSLQWDVSTTRGHEQDGENPGVADGKPLAPGTTPAGKRTPSLPSWAWAQSLPGCAHCPLASWLLCLHEGVARVEWNWTLRGQPIQPSCSARGKALL